MKKLLIVLQILLFLFSFCACGVSESDYASMVAERNRLQVDYDTLKSEYDEVSSRYDELSSNYASLESDHNKLMAETADWVKLTETEKAAQLAQAESDRIAAEENAKKAREEQAAAERAAAEEAQRRADEEAAAKAEAEKRAHEEANAFDAFLGTNHVELSSKDVQYDPAGNLNRLFLLEGTASLSRYYNYGYDDAETTHFCLKVRPSGGKSSDDWYIYCNRENFQELLNKAKDSDELTIRMVCKVVKWDSGQGSLQAELVYVGF